MEYLAAPTAFHQGSCGSAIRKGSFALEPLSQPFLKIKRGCPIIAPEGIANLLHLAAKPLLVVKLSNIPSFCPSDLRQTYITSL